MTDADLRTVPGSLLAEHATLAHETRTKAPWGKTIPDALYFNDVLPYAQLDETRDPWRKMLMDRFAADAWKCKTAGAAAVMLNRSIFKALNVTYNATRRPRPTRARKKASTPTTPPAPASRSCWPTRAARAASRPGSRASRRGRTTRATRTETTAATTLGWRSGRTGSGTTSGRPGASNSTARGSARSSARTRWTARPGCTRSSRRASARRAARSRWSGRWTT